MFLRAVFLAIFIALFPAIASADQPLIFRDSARGLREQEVIDYLGRVDKFNTAQPYRISAIDLNGDGVEEWIVFQISTQTCVRDKNCVITVAGLASGTPAILGEMHGGKIAVSDEKLYGIHKLLVYNEKNNDFAYQTYAWIALENGFRPQ